MVSVPARERGRLVGSDGSIGSNSRGQTEPFVGAVLLVGTEFLQHLAAEGGFSAKMVFNAKGAIFFPCAGEHREQKAEGISYEDNYRGNALAAMLSPGKVDVRFHKGFTDAQVCAMVRSLLACSELSFLRGWRITYQGRPLAVS